MQKAYPQTGNPARRKDVGVAAQAYVQWNKQTVVERYSVLDALAKPPTGFKLPLTFLERTLLFLSLLARKVDVLEHSFVLRPSTIAPHWNIILQFLHREGIAKTSEFSRELFSNDKPKFPCVGINARVNAIGQRNGRDVTLYGFGAAGTYEDAMSKAVGELLERFFLATCDRNTLLVSTAGALRKSGLNFLDPDSLPAFRDWQKETSVDAYSQERELTWVPVRHLRSGEALQVPAQLIFWKLDISHAKEPTLGHHTTNGGGGHFSREGAYLSAIYERVQRDGFLIYWLNNLSPSVIDVGADSDEYLTLAKMLEYLKRYNIHPIFLNTTSDIRIPSVTCAIVDTNGKVPLITVGAGTGFDFETIALAALYESISVNRAQNNSEPFVLPTDYRPFTDKTIRRSERLSMWQGDAQVKKFDFFISGKRQSVSEFMGERRAFAGEKEELEQVILLLEESGYHVYGYEVQNRVLRKLGYHVVKTVIPGLVPIYLQENLALLAAERLRTVPEKIGYEPAKELNPWPHPFP